MSQLKAKGIKPLELDFTCEESIQEAAKSFADRPLDVLVNCGGKLT